MVKGMSMWAGAGTWAPEWSVPRLCGGVWCGIMFGAMLRGFRVLNTLYSVRYGVTRALGGGTR
jgi:hypothetical protein